MYGWIKFLKWKYMLCIICTEIIYMSLLCSYLVSGTVCSLYVVLAENMTLRSTKVFVSMIHLKELLAYVLIG